jgi:hypothetical protein
MQAPYGNGFEELHTRPMPILHRTEIEMDRFEIALKKKPSEQITVKNIFERSRSVNFNYCARNSSSTNYCKYLFKTNSRPCKYGAGREVYGNIDYGPCPHYIGYKEGL